MGNVRNWDPKSPAKAASAKRRGTSKKDEPEVSDTPVAQDPPHVDEVADAPKVHGSIHYTKRSSHKADSAE